MKPEESRSCLGRGELDADHRGFPISSQTYFLGVHDASGIFHVERDAVASEAVLCEHHIDHDRRSFEDLLRRLDSTDLDVAGQDVASHSNRVNGNPIGLVFEQWLGEFRSGVVGSVGDQDDPG